MEQEVNLSAIHKSEMMEEQYPDRNDIFEDFLNEHSPDNEMEIQEKNKLYHSLSSQNLNRHSDFRKILNNSSSDQRLLIHANIREPYSSRENSLLGGQFKRQTENSFDSESFRKSFKKKFQQSFSVSHTIRDSSSSFSERSQKSSRNIIIIPHVYDQQKGSGQMVQEKKTGCNCKKSKCLKLYCQCFQKQMFCTQSCNCQGCGNQPTNKQEHKKAIFNALARNAHTLKHGFEQEQAEVENVPENKVFSLGVHHEQVRKGCKCKKTKCLKKYCECYQSGVSCTLFCRCEGCYNNKPQTVTPESHQFMHLVNNI